MAKGKNSPISTPVNSLFKTGSIDAAMTGAIRGSEPGYQKQSQSSQIPSPVIRVKKS